MTGQAKLNVGLVYLGPGADQQGTGEDIFASGVHLLHQIDVSQRNDDRDKPAYLEMMAT